MKITWVILLILMLTLLTSNVTWNNYQKSSTYRCTIRRHFHEVVSADLSGRGKYHEIVRTKDIPPLDLFGQGVFLVKVHAYCKWEVRMEVWSGTEDSSQGLAHTEVLVIFQGKVIRLYDSGPPYGEDLTVMPKSIEVNGQEVFLERHREAKEGGARYLELATMINSEEGGPAFSIIAAAGGHGLKGGKFLSHAKIEIEGVLEAIPVNETLRHASFTWEPKRPKAGEPVTFEATLLKEAKGYYWNFGDKSKGKGISVTHVYPRPGKYRVTLSIALGNGGLKTISREITVFSVPEEGKKSVKYWANAFNKIQRNLVKNAAFKDYLRYKARYYNIKWSVKAGEMASSVFFVVNTINPITINTIKFAPPGFAGPLQFKKFVKFIKSLWKMASRNVKLSTIRKTKIAKKLMVKMAVKKLANKIMKKYEEQAQKAIEILRKQAEDPPLEDYSKVFKIQLPSPAFYPDPSSSLEEKAAITIMNSLIIQNAIEEALLISLERYQGALKAADPQYISLQAMMVINYTNLSIQNLMNLSRALNIIGEFINTNREDIENRLKSLKLQLVELNFSAEQLKEIQDVGLSNEDIEILRQLLLNINLEPLCNEINFLNSFTQSRIKVMRNLLNHMLQVQKVIPSFLRR